MATTRSSQGSSPPAKSAAKPKATRKRPADSSAETGAPKKRGRPAKKEQKTIEETMNGGDEKADDKDEVKDNEKAEGEDKDVKMKNGDASKAEEAITNGEGIEDDKAVAEQINGDNPDSKPKEKNAFDEVKADAGEVKEAAVKEQDEKTGEIQQNNASVVEDEKREAAIPSSILEKGIIYFFFRPRVNITEPQGIEDVARSYIVLRPLPLGAKLGDGPLEDTGNARLLALPKKMLPKSKTDRFLVFVDKANAHIKDLREQFSGNEYATQTSGTSNTQPAAPFAEGIYAITSTGRESHLAYQLTVPTTIGEIQKELGLHERGSFVVSAKNPETPSPGNAGLDNPAKYPTALQQKFRNLRWMPLEPELLNYDNTQVLLIGEGLGDFGKSVEEQSKDAKDGEKEKPEEEMVKLEEEDHDRVENLKEDDPVFADLGLSSKEFSGLQTTW
ncbi:hypothetical protein LSUE1_G009699, partial [Lachnellula suecica]